MDLKDIFEKIFVNAQERFVRDFFFCDGKLTRAFDHYRTPPHNLLVTLYFRAIYACDRSVYPIDLVFADCFATQASPTCTSSVFFHIKLRATGFRQVKQVENVRRFASFLFGIQRQSFKVLRPDKRKYVFRVL